MDTLTEQFSGKLHKFSGKDVNRFPARWSSVNSVKLVIPFGILLICVELINIFCNEINSPKLSGMEFKLGELTEKLSKFNKSGQC